MNIDELQVAQLANGGIGSVRLELALRQCGADVMLLSEPAQVLQHLQSDACSVGVVDLDIPGIPDTFFETLQRLRNEDQQLRVLGCGSPAVSQRIAGLYGSSLDDFILRPLDADELAIRLKLILDGEQTTATTVLEQGDLQLDIASREVKLDGAPVDLTARERSVLQSLMRDAGEVISKNALAGRLSTMEEEIAPQTVETYVHGLRKKLKDSIIDIETVRGAGYLLKPP